MRNFLLIHMAQTVELFILNRAVKGRFHKVLGLS